MNFIKHTGFQYLLAIGLAFVANQFNVPAITNIAEFISTAFVVFFKWCSIPMLSLALLSTASSLNNKAEFWFLGKSVVKYTIITTAIAASIALGLFLILKPTNSEIAIIAKPLTANESNNAFGILLFSTMFIALLLSVAILYCKPTIKWLINLALTACFRKLMHLLQNIIKLMPLAIWAFATIFLQDLDSLMTTSLLLYLACVVLANLIQAILVLPILLNKNGIAPLKLLKQMWPAIAVAFWSKSSGVALPVAMRCAIERANLDEKITKFSLPICTTINMNACSAFILTTVLFVSTSYGMHYTALQLVAWVGIATLTAIGNASVPMGCFTMSMALLGILNVPLHAMGLILPFYALLDMLESAINIWSDSCVTAIVAKQLTGSTVAVVKVQQS